jgi:glycosyltransferase involved in cell wall biosynthesis
LDLGSFDIVHVHHLSWGAIRAATDRSPTPFVFTLHGSTPEHPRAASFVIRRADGIVGLADMEVVSLECTYATRGADVVVIPNGIDPTVFPFRQPRHPEAGPWRILFVGQLIPKKGVDRLLRAIAKLRQRHPMELELRFHNDEEEASLRALTHELQLDDVVSFAGPATQDELKERYWVAHFVVLPSRTGEALPAVLTEAMLTGCFPVATDVGSVREQLGEFGLLVPSANDEGVVTGIVTAIDQAIATYDTHVLRARRMRDYAKSRFSMEGMISSHEELYRRLCAGSRNPRRHRGRLRVGTSLAGPTLDTWIRLMRPFNKVRKGT